jgi:translation initiation factor 2B subunit (eIF-2B alpha/beta/delta family)
MSKIKRCGNKDRNEEIQGSNQIPSNNLEILHRIIHANDFKSGFRITEAA